MQEILPGIHHWTAFRDVIQARVSSHYVAPAAILIDPMLPEEGGMEELRRLDPRPQQIVLSNGHHDRHSAQIADAFDIPIRVPFPARDALRGQSHVSVFEFGDEVAPGVHAIKVGKLAPDETALWIEHGDGAMGFGDSLTNHAGALGFFPDERLGAHPRRVQDGLRDAFRGLLLRGFDALLFAHGDPVPHHGKARLREFTEHPVGQPDYGTTL